MMEKFPYRITVEPDDECDWIARVPAFPFLAVDAPTRSEAVDLAEEMGLEHLRLMKEDGDPIPEPDSLEKYSGQLRLRMSKTLHRDVARYATRNGVSINNAITTILSGGLGRVRDVMVPLYGRAPDQKSKRRTRAPEKRATNKNRPANEGKRRTTKKR